MTAHSRFSAVVCGAGVAGLEAVLRLRAIAGDRIDITVVNPTDRFSYRPHAAREPFSTVAPRTYPLADILRALDVNWIRDDLSWVDREASTVHTGGGATVPYDALLVAVGARRQPPPAGAVSFSDRTAGALKPLFRKIFVGETHSVLFVEPDGPCWPLPIYELAMQTARLAAGNGHRAEVHLSVPGPRPLDAFGVEAGLTVSDLLARDGVTLHTNATLQSIGTDRVLFDPTGAVEAEQVITIPRLTGPDVRGLPGEAYERFVRIDQHSRVVDELGIPTADGRIFAAGDCTQLLIKHGGVGSQQADTAADEMLHLAGLGAGARPLHPVVEGLLQTGSGSLHLRAQLVAGRGWHATVGPHSDSASMDKIFAAELGPFLTRFHA